MFVAQDLLGAAAHGGGAGGGPGPLLALALLRRSPAYADTLLPPILSATTSARLVRTHLHLHLFVYVTYHIKAAALRHLNSSH